MPKCLVMKHTLRKNRKKQLIVPVSTSHNINVSVNNTAYVSEMLKLSVKWPVGT